MTTLELDQFRSPGPRLARPTFELSAAPARRVFEALYRVLAVVLLIATLPLLVAIAIAVMFSSPGGALFSQTRVGQGGRSFTMWKFRTMHAQAESALDAIRHHNEHHGPLFKIRNDPRVTKVGRWLRRSSLDELPQLWNVVRGDMSLVGPRPALPREVAEYDYLARRRLEVKPGLTGLWQVSGRSHLSWDDSIVADLEYVDRWSLGLELKILLRTPVAVSRGAGAY